MGFKKLVKKAIKSSVKVASAPIKTGTNIASSILGAAGVKVPAGGLLGNVLSPGVEKTNEAAAAEAVASEQAMAQAEAKKKADELAAVQAEAQRLASIQRAVPGVQALDAAPASVTDKIALAQIEAKKKAKAARATLSTPKTILG